jgi:hypothetical protein
LRGPLEPFSAVQLASVREVPKVEAVQKCTITLKYAVLHPALDIHGGH